jgi:hypothetical protein
MTFAPRLTYSHAMVRHLGLIESARAVVDILPLPPDQELRLRQAARQRATRHSTRIEGNTLNSEQVGQAVMAVGKSHTEMQQFMDSIFIAHAHCSRKMCEFFGRPQCNFFRN